MTSTVRRWTSGYKTARSSLLRLPSLTLPELPRFVIKGGVVIVEQGEIRAELQGRTLRTAPDYDEVMLPDIKKWFEAYYTIQFANYPVDRHHLSAGGYQVPCRIV